MTADATHEMRNIEMRNANYKVRPFRCKLLLISKRGGYSVMGETIGAQFVLNFFGAQRRFLESRLRR